MLIDRIMWRLRRIKGRILGPRAKNPKRDIFSIGLLRGESPFALDADRSNPVIDRRSVTDEEAVYVADPFLVKEGEAWHLFFETLAKDPDQPGAEKGVIGLASSRDGTSWTYRGTILREFCHLSYPHVFKWDGDFYMVPESRVAGAVRLYRATSFPETWEFEQNLLEGDDYNDATPFHHEGRWWMLSSSGEAPIHADTLRLHMADDLRGPWEEHPCSPLVESDKCTARPAGRVIKVDGALHRFAQECEPYYGMLVRAFRIEELTPETYREREIPESPILKGSGEGWNREGMHHIDAHQLENGSWAAVVDGWFWGTEKS